MADPRGLLLAGLLADRLLIYRKADTTKATVNARLVPIAVIFADMNPILILPDKLKPVAA
jgi:hypothetical protein